MKTYQGIIFFDLDGTLLNSKSQISPENIVVLQQLEAKNYLAVIASGRSPIEIEAMTKNTAISSYVSLNGQYVVIEGAVFASHEIDKNVIRRVTEFAANLGHPVACYTPSAYRINFIDAATEKLYTLDNAPLPKIDTEFYLEQRINMLYLFSENTEHDAVLQNEFKDELTFYRDSSYSMAIVNKNRSKKAGLLEVLEKIELVNPENTYAFGDGNNDLSMFEAVTHAVAMGNANEQVKKAATFITHDHEADGIKFALEHFGIL